MLKNDAKEIFGEVLLYECPECKTPRGTLCDTPMLWVHRDRIQIADIEDHGYLITASIKKIVFVQPTLNVSEVYANLTESFRNVAEQIDRLNAAIQAIDLTEFEKFQEALTTLEKYHEE